MQVDISSFPFAINLTANVTTPIVHYSVLLAPRYRLNELLSKPLFSCIESIVRVPSVHAKQ